MPLGKPVSGRVTNCLGDFKESIKLLMEQLKYIQIMCNKLASRHHVHAIAAQAAASLDALAQMDVAIAKDRRSDSVFELVSGVLALTKLSQKVNKELKT